MNMKALASVLLALVLATYVVPSGAQSIEEQSRNIFNSMTNVSDPAVIRGVREGVISGGSISVRNQITNIRPYNLQLPRVKAGCGGIDIFMGSFSFISSDQLVAALRAIPGAAVSYGFSLALKSMCPSCEEAISKLQSEVNKWSSGMMNTCQLTTAMFEQSGMTQAIQSTFTKNNALEGWASDYLKANRQGESTTPEQKTAEVAPEAHREIIPGNIVWKALKESSAANWLVDVTGGSIMPEIIMSVTGTAIYCTPGVDGCPNNPDEVGPKGGTNPTYKPPLLSLHTFVFGSEDAHTNTARYSCGGDDMCLAPQIVDEANVKGLKKMLEDVVIGANGVSGMVDAIDRGDRAPTSEEMGLLSNGGVYIQMVVDLARVNPVAAKNYFLSFSDVVAGELALRILTADLEAALHALASQTGGSVNEGRRLVQEAMDRNRDLLKDLYVGAQGRSALFESYRVMLEVQPAKKMAAAPVGSTD